MLSSKARSYMGKDSHISFPFLDLYRFENREITMPQTKKAYVYFFLDGETFMVEELAKQWNMSVSQFHQKFKNAIGMGPLQCQKRLRLTEARRLLFDEGKNVTEAAFDVGYESVSQFTREYKKMFGSSPSEDIELMKKTQQK